MPAVARARPSFPAAPSTMHQIVAEYAFAAAHLLPNHRGRCRNLHGHNYRFHVVIRGVPDPETGMVIDFGDVEAVVTDRVLVRCENRYLNDLMPNPTAENIATWIWDQLDGALPGLFEIQLWEIPHGSVVYRGPRGLGGREEVDG